MTQFSTQTEDFLSSNRHIYDVIYLANNANGDIVSTENPLPVTGNVTATLTGTSNISFTTTQTDAFGRLRVSEPFTIIDAFNRYQDNGYYAYSTSGSGSTGYNANNASILLNVGSGASDAVYAETIRVFAYQPGKSLLVMQTFTFAAPQTNLTQRAGYFDANNGIYLEQVGTTVNIVKRSSSTGSIVETRIAQNAWNVNTLGSLDLTKSQIFWMDLEWLGVGSVRCGFVINGQFVHCHTFNHANLITGVYMSTSCLPIRKEIFNTGLSSGTSTMNVICHTVISEGGYTLNGRPRCIGNTLGTPISLPNDLTFKPVMSIRLKNTRLGAIVLPTTFTVSPVQQAIYKYQIYTKAITTGGTWTSFANDSSVEYNISPSTISSGNVTNTGFINASNQTSGELTNSAFPFFYQLERDSFAMTMYEIVIAVASSTNSTSCYGSINWEEVT